MSPPTHVLVGIDGSEESLAAWRYATGLARCCHCRLTALHVAMPYWPASSFDRDVWRAARAEEAARARGHAVLERARSLATDVDEVDCILVFGEPAEKICQQAREVGADLIALGSRGLCTVERLFSRSVSLKVVRRAPCSVLVVRGE